MTRRLMTLLIAALLGAASPAKAVDVAPAAKPPVTSPQAPQSSPPLAIAAGTATVECRHDDKPLTYSQRTERLPDGRYRTTVITPQGKEIESRIRQPWQFLTTLADENDRKDGAIDRETVQQGRLPEIAAMKVGEILEGSVDVGREGRGRVGHWQVTVRVRGKRPATDKALNGAEIVVVDEDVRNDRGEVRKSTVGFLPAIGRANFQRFTDFQGRLTECRTVAWVPASAPVVVADKARTGAPQPAPAAAAANAAKIADAAAMRDEKRVALVIGNADYRSAPLKNPVNDARDVSGSLRQLGFEVIELENATYGQMQRAIDDFGKRIQRGGVAMFFYSGHGMQVKGENFLIPVDAELKGEAETRYKTVNVGLLLAQLDEAKSRVNLVVLDACRDNPFARSFRSTGGAGLAAIDAPQGTMIMYATAPGRTAADGAGKNGLYTEEFLKQLRTPGLKVEDMMKKVRVAVRERSNGDQVPWEASSLEGDFFFRLR